MKFDINPKERFYFYTMSAISIAAYPLLGYFEHSTLLLYVGISLTLQILFSVFFIGYIKGNAIKVTAKQFPDVFNILKQHSQTLELSKVPDMYIMQGNGVLNAFATRIKKRNIIVLYSDVFEMAYEGGIDAVSFIIGHELGHIKRNHVGFWKSILTLPGQFIPFLNFAYSRGCEYTCDNIGYNLSPKGALNGLLILVAGKKLYKKVNLSNFVNDEDRSGFAYSFTEIFYTHPHMIKRLSAINQLIPNNLDLEDSDFIIPKTNYKNTEIQA